MYGSLPSSRALISVSRLIPSRSAACWVVRVWDVVEIVTLVGGGAPEPMDPPADKPLDIGKFRFLSRLFTGTGKYATYDLMRDCLAASGCEVTTVAVRRERQNADDPDLVSARADLEQARRRLREGHPRS